MRRPNQSAMRFNAVLVLAGGGRIGASTVAVMFARRVRVGE